MNKRGYIMKCLISFVGVILISIGCQQKFNENKKGNENSLSKIQEKKLSSSFKAIYTINKNGEKTLVGAEGDLIEKEKSFILENPLSVNERTTNITLEIDGFINHFGEVKSLVLENPVEISKSDFSYAVDKKNDSLVLSFFGINKISLKKKKSLKILIFTEKKSSSLVVDLRKTPNLLLNVENDQSVIESLDAHRYVRILGDTFRNLVFFRVKNQEKEEVELTLKNKSVSLFASFEKRNVVTEECTFSEKTTRKSLEEEVIFVPLSKLKADSLSNYTKEEDLNQIIPLSPEEEVLIGAYVSNEVPKIVSWNNGLPFDTLYVVANSCKNYCSGDHLYRKANLINHYSGVRNYNISIPKLTSLSFKFKKENKNFPLITVESKELVIGSSHQKPEIPMYIVEYPFEVNKKIKHKGCYTPPLDPCEKGGRICPR
jgi:hypothetical protein